jgi:hypothetical protein
MNLFSWIHHGSDAERGSVDAARGLLEEMITLANPRLRFARKYRARLEPAVQSALVYARVLVASVPPARDATAAAWNTDCYLRAFFATPRDLVLAFSRSPQLAMWFSMHPEAREVYAVLSMQLVEKRILGVSVEDNVLKRDVPQTTLSFADYRVRMFGSTEVELRQDIERRVVAQMAMAALAMALGGETRRTMLEQERALLKLRRKLLENQGAGMSELARKGGPDERSEMGQVSAQLAINEANLKALSAGSEGLDQQVEGLRDVLMRPQEHFNVANRRVRMDRMNIVLNETSTVPGETIDLQIARVPVPDAPPEFRTFIFVRFPRSELVPPSELIGEAVKTLI